VAEGLKILYGVNGEGMGHATRSEVVIDALLERHDVRVVAGGAAFRYLTDRLPRVDEIFGPSFALEDGEIRKWASVRQSVHDARLELPETLKHWVSLVEGWKPDVVITDFEPLAGVYARTTRTPLIAIDNIHMLVRCHHDEEIVGAEHRDFTLACAVTKAMVPGALSYIVTTFFDAPVAYEGTTLVPPILRPEIIAAESTRGEHLLVYSSGEEELLDSLRRSGMPCRVYGMRGDRAPEDSYDGNLEFRPHSNEGFVADLAGARAVIAGGGFSLLSEAVYLGKPVLSVPLHGQFEQLMNARYLERSGFGLCANEVTPEVLQGFIGRLGEFDEALAGYEQEGNAIPVATVEAHAEAAVTARPRELRRERRRSKRRVK
jgi:uncharacterized protein (TIGR00661 family)